MTAEEQKNYSHVGGLHWGRNNAAESQESSSLR